MFTSTPVSNKRIAKNIYTFFLCIFLIICAYKARNIEPSPKVRKESIMLAEFSIVPVGTGSSIGDKLAEVLKIVDSSGLPYKINPMGTVIEGEWDDVIALIKTCHDAMMKSGERAITKISIDDRKGMPNRIDSKVESIERRIGKPLKK
jgi:uncharacterized protein (TIGR00106 family)